MIADVSIIIPLYNAEDNIKELLSILKQQRVQAKEIIVVNDGSPDGSREIVSKMAEEMPNVILVDKKN